MLHGHDIIDPSQIIRARSSGTANMGTVTDRSSVARAGSLTSIWTLLYIRLHFSAGSGVATCQVQLDANEHTLFDFILDEFQAVGTGSDVNFRLEPDDYVHWTFRPQDAIVLIWTNPDSGTMNWGSEIGFVERIDESPVRI